jgi:hypothetical protein
MWEHLLDDRHLRGQIDEMITATGFNITNNALHISGIAEPV